MNSSPEHIKNATMLVQKLIGLGIKAKMKDITEGPVVTSYSFTLEISESVNKILKRSEDLALSLGADKVIVQRIGGEIHIFVPNKEKKIVDFKDVLHWYLNSEEAKSMQLPIPLGVSYNGTKSCIDLADCPHLLLTGSTGSGKSVFEAAIISSLIYFFNSSELNFYLVDTKQLDLPLFKSLPHVRNVADNLDDFHNMMHFIMPEIRRRNGVMQNAGVRKITEYHTMMGGRESMPFIVLMLDEFGDLMDLDSAYRKADKEKYETTPTVKQWIKSVVQIGRAAGVHIIACTQRASVKVIDGDIKANLPCRIALRLPTQIDSRTILGTSGAENLLGKGDMLIQRPEKDTLERFHGPFVSMSDIQQLIMNYDQIKSIMGR